jgi:hypothetical protein
LVKINANVAAQFRLIQPLPSPGSNLIFNGGFEINACDGTKNQWCSYHEAGYFNQVAGW